MSEHITTQLFGPLLKLNNYGAQMNIGLNNYLLLGLILMSSS